MAWKEYGPEPWGTTGISYACAWLHSQRWTYRAWDKLCDSRSYTDELGKTSQPHDIGLQDSNGSILDEFSETIPIISGRSPVEDPTHLVYSCSPVVNLT